MAVATIFLLLLSSGHSLALTVPWTLPFPLLTLMLESSFAEDEVIELVFFILSLATVKRLLQSTI